VVIGLSILQSQKNVIQINCPVCGRKDSIIVTKSELWQARENHSLITKAISHSDEGHVLTLYIDGEGIIRRKYCFQIAEKKMKLLKGSISKNLDSIFEKMIQESKK